MPNRYLIPAATDKKSRSARLPEQPSYLREFSRLSTAERASTSAGLNARDSYAPGLAIAINCAVSAVLLPSVRARRGSGQNGGEKIGNLVEPPRGGAAARLDAPAGSLREISMREVSGLLFSRALLLQ